MNLSRWYIIWFLSLGICLVANAQKKTPKQAPQTTALAAKALAKPLINADSTKADSLKVNADSLKKDEMDSFKSSLKYVSEDSTITDIVNKITYLYGNARVNYEDIELKADYIRIDWSKNEVFAKGTLDTATKKKVNFPVFKQGGTNYNADSMRYNFKTKKGIIRAIITQQGEGFVQGKNVKKDQEDNLYLVKGLYTTCDLEHPHFHINMSKFKVANNPEKGTKQVISGPFNLVINDVPLPIGLPFGFFPMPKQKEAGTSGIIFPQYGNEPQGRGIYLRDGGYYFAINQYINATVTTQFYSRGGWGVGVSSQYKKLYRYQGNLSMNYNYNTTGDEANPRGTPDFQIRWSHSPQSYGRSTFSASVNASTNGYSVRNSYDTRSYLQSAMGSSVQYSHTFGTVARSSVSLRVNQNMATRALDAGINYSFGINQFQPLHRKDGTPNAFLDAFRMSLDVTGDYSFTNQIRVSSYGYNFNAKIENQTYTKDTTLKVNFSTLPELLRNAQMKTRYSIPITLPSFRVFKYINITPSFTYQGEIYTRRQSFRYNGKDSVLVSSDEGFFNTYNYSFAMSANTRLYGTYRFKNLGRLQAIRHTINPSVSASLAPNFGGENFGFFQKVQVNQKGDFVYAPRFVGLTSAPTAVAALSFGITNTLEAKLKSKYDTSAKGFEKVPLLNNLSLNGSYNFLADSLKLSDISLSTSANLLKKFNINLNATFDPYQYVATEGFSTGKKINKLLIEQGTLAALKTANFSLSTNFKPKTASDAAAKKTTPNATPEQLKRLKENPEAYVDFDIPWALNLSYQWSYSKVGTETTPRIVSSATFSGDFSLTPKWKFTFNSGYDFKYKAITYSQIGITRDLHCWAMAFNWTPAAQGARANTYSFDLYVKSAMLRDLKLSRRRTFYDRGVF
jgi:LptD protein